MYDVIVIGAGAVGSSTALQLVDRGANVLAIDQFHPPHDRGSSHGQTRLIRQAYFEHPDYVPLILRAYELWHQLEARSNRQLFHRTGLVSAGPPDGEIIPGIRHSSQRHNLAISNMTPRDANREFPGLAIEDSMDVLFEHAAGYLEVENAIQATLDLAKQQGCHLRTNELVRTWSTDGPNYCVTTDRGNYTARHLVLAGGAWAASLIQPLHARLTVLRKTMHWFDVEPGYYLAKNRFPAFLAETPHGIAYGFPVIDDLGLKAAMHTGGQFLTNPANCEKIQKSGDAQPILAFLQSWLPKVRPQQRHFATCMYTMTPDQHFCIDRHPHHERVAFAAGLSGHGFKFAPVLGEILADLALQNTTRWPIQFLSIARFHSDSPPAAHENSQ